MQAIKKSVHVAVCIVCILFIQVLQTAQYCYYQKEELSLNLLIESPIPTFITIKPNQQSSEQVEGERGR